MLGGEDDFFSPRFGKKKSDAFIPALPAPTEIPIEEVSLLFKAVTKIKLGNARFFGNLPHRRHARGLARFNMPFWKIPVPWRNRAF